MATKIGTPIKRQMEVTVEHLGVDRELIAELHSPAHLILRPKGTKTKVVVNMGDLYRGEGSIRLTRPVERLTETKVRDRSQNRQLMVALLPGDVIRLWPEGVKSAAYEVSLATVYAMAGRLEGERQRREKQLAKKGSK